MSCILENLFLNIKISDYTGLKEILKSIPRIEAIDAEDAVDHVASPEIGEVTYPFSLGSHKKTDPATSPAKTTSTESSKKGTKEHVKLDKKKYGKHNIPKALKKLLKKASSIPSKWKNYLLQTGSASLALTTWKKYNSAYNAYSKFCSEENVSEPWPIAKNANVCFILWCEKTLKIRAETIKSYLSALQSISKLLGFENHRGQKETAKFLVRGIERSEQKLCHTPTDPLIFEILVELRKILKEKKWKKQSKKVVWACICLGYFGSFRAIELLTKHSNSFDPSSNCTWADLTISAKHMSINIKNPKTKGGKTEKIELFSFPNKHFCPIKAILALEKSSRKSGCFNENLPIFRFLSGKFLTVSALSDILKKLLGKSKFKNRKISAKSLRSGVPTDLENHPELFDDMHIKIWGRWKSNAYQRYMKDDKYQREWIFQKMCQILTPFCN